MIAEADAVLCRRDDDEKKVAEETEALLNAQSRVAQHRQLERELRIQADFQKRFPIPVRMPKTVKLDLSLPFDMELVDYTWGGKMQCAKKILLEKICLLQLCLTFCPPLNLQLLQGQ